MREKTLRRVPKKAIGFRLPALGLGVLLTAGSAYATDVRDHRGEAPLIGPSGYTFCAREGDHCRFSGTVNVAYGGPAIDNGKIFTREVTFVYRYGVSGGIDCKDGNFPNPPDDEYQVKACYVRSVLDHRGSGPGGEGGGPAGFSKCAEHGQHCSFRGTADMAYGPPGGPFVHQDAVSNGLDCDGRGFPRVVITPGSTSEFYYACYMRLLAPTTPTPQPTKTPMWKTPTATPVVRDHR